MCQNDSSYITVGGKNPKSENERVEFYKNWFEDPHFMKKCATNFGHKGHFRSSPLRPAQEAVLRVITFCSSEHTQSLLPLGHFSRAGNAPNPALRVPLAVTWLTVYRQLTSCA